MVLQPFNQTPFLKQSLSSCSTPLLIVWFALVRCRLKNPRIICIMLVTCTSNFLTLYSLHYDWFFGGIQRISAIVFWQMLFIAQNIKQTLCTLYRISFGWSHNSSYQLVLSHALLSEFNCLLYHFVTLLKGKYSGIFNLQLCSLCSCISGTAIFFSVLYLFQ